MKSLLSVLVLALWAQAAQAQLVNPTVIQQDTDIILQNTDVYYTPFAPPDSTDTPEQLSCLALNLHDSDGVNRWNLYQPMTHGMLLKTFVGGCDTCPDTVAWMRLFQAKDKPSGAHSDIIVGCNVAHPDTVIYPGLDGHPWDTVVVPKDTGDVIISKNEDVDFRASGTIRMEDGFHVMPGAFFHAYQEPKWDTTVFSDEFDDTAKFNRQWVIWDSAAGSYQCSYASNLALDTSFDAHDGHALRLDFWKDSLCNCVEVSGGGSSQACEFRKDTARKHQNIFSAANFKSCPWPWDSVGDPLRRAYHNAPYGKYEVREKIPNFKHHTNAYTGDQSNEYNLYETYNGNMTVIHPGLSKQHVFGPFKGRFAVRHGLEDTSIFQSACAHFAFWNKPYAIMINNFPYEVTLIERVADTLLVANATTTHQGGFPTSLVADSANEVTFYYVKPQNDSIVSDSLGWSVEPTGRYFTGAYADSSGHLLYFNKDYQPTKIYLFDSNVVPKKSKEFECHWDHNTGKVYINRTDTSGPMPSWSSHTGIMRFGYQKEEGPQYPTPPIPVDFTNYEYHTYTMELLPHEAHFLIDGYVVRRFPDRLIPRTDFRYDYVTSMARTPFHLEPGEIDFDGGVDFAPEKLWFETYDTSRAHGAWDVNGHHAAHHLIDYVKVWDVPSEMKLPDFPQ